jgi:hypothetical protein
MIEAQSFDADECALRDAIATACRERAVGAPFDHAAWLSLASLGALTVGNDGESGARALVAVYEALGEAAHAGPLAETVIALSVLGAGVERAAIERADSLACVGAAPHWPFAAEARLVFAIEQGAVHPARLTGEARSVTTLAGDRWLESSAELEPPLAASAQALALGRLAAAALLVGAGRVLLERAAERARTRQQFGQPIGSHQAVSHPLADCSIRLSAAEGVLRSAAWIIDQEGSNASDAGGPGAAFESARGAALAAAYQAHQTFGALGITLEGPVFAITRRIRQWASLPLGGHES